MKSIIFTLSILLIGASAFAQGKYFTRDGHIKFFSSTPVEDIEGNNHKVTSVLDEATGKLEFAALMKSFEFEKALMEEHFNENYVESNTYPKATFKGEVVGFKMGSYDEPKSVTAKGALTIHGVTKDVSVEGTMGFAGDKYTIDAQFIVLPEDYKIEIPGTVRDNIAKEIEVTVDVELDPLKK